MQKAGYILVVLVMVSGCDSFGQGGYKTADRSLACDSNVVFAVIEDMPDYVGGVDKLKLELQKRLKFEKSVKGTVYIQLIVDCNGKAVGHVVMKGLSKEIDNRVLEEVSKIQNWKVGTHLSKAVDCFYTFSIKLKKGKVVL